MCDCRGSQDEGRARSRSVMRQSIATAVLYTMRTPRITARCVCTRSRRGILWVCACITRAMSDDAACATGGGLAGPGASRSAVTLAVHGSRDAHNLESQESQPCTAVHRSDYRRASAVSQLARRCAVERCTGRFPTIREIDGRCAAHSTVVSTE